MKQFYRVMRTISLVMMVVGLCSAFWPFLGLAQEATIAAPAPSMMDTVMAVLKAVLPTIMSFLGPLITKGVAALFEGLSPAVGGSLSTVLGAVFGAVTAGFEGLPMDGYGAVGAGSGLTAHALMQAKPITAPVVTTPAGSTLPAVALVMLLPLLGGCGKTLDQIKQVAHHAIDVAGKVYEDVKDNVTTAKQTLGVEPVQAPPPTN